MADLSIMIKGTLKAPLQCANKLCMYTPDEVPGSFEYTDNLLMIAYAVWTCPQCKHSNKDEIRLRFIPSWFRS